MTAQEAAKHPPGYTQFQISDAANQLKPFIEDPDYRGEEWTHRGWSWINEWNLPRKTVAKVLGTTPTRLTQWRQGQNKTRFPQMDAIVEGHIPTKLFDEIVNERVCEAQLRWEVERKWLYDKNRDG